jgi:hypothetical protein
MQRIIMFMMSHLNFCLGTEFANDRVFLLGINPFPIIVNKYEDIDPEYLGFDLHITMKRILHLEILEN